MRRISAQDALRARRRIGPTARRTVCIDPVRLEKPYLVRQVALCGKCAERSRACGPRRPWRSGRSAWAPDGLAARTTDQLLQRRRRAIDDGSHSHGRPLGIRLIEEAHEQIARIVRDAEASQCRPAPHRGTDSAQPAAAARPRKLVART